MLNKLSKTLVFSTILFNSTNAIAGAFPQDSNKLFASEGLYYSLPRKSGFNGQLGGDTQPDADFSFSSNAYSIHQTSELQYGLNKDWQLGAKIDIGYIHDDIKIGVNNGTQSSDLSFTLDYASIAPEVSIKRLLSTDKDGSVWTADLALMPGEFIIGSYDSFHNWKEAAYKLSLLRGYKFKADLSPFDNKQRDHYIELELAATHFFNLGRASFDVTPSVAIRPAQNFLVITELRNTFDFISYKKKPFPKGVIERNVDSVSFLDATQKAAFKNVLLNENDSLTTRHSDHSLDLKFSYEIPNTTKVISIEGITEVFSSRSFKNSTILLSYDVLY